MPTPGCGDRARKGILLLALVTVWSCGGGGDGGTEPPPPAIVVAVELSPNTASVPIGLTTQFTAVAKSASGATLSRAFTWTSSDQTKATVSSGGEVTGVAIGSVTITATADGKSGTASLTVLPPPVASVTITRDTASLVVGVNIQLSATAKDAAGGTLSRPIQWTSSDPSKASVSSNGLVTGVALGAATITATSEGKSATATITVKDGAIIGAAGGTITALSGRVTLNLPADAVSASTMITVEDAVGVPVDPRLVPLTSVRIGPSSLTLTGNADLTVRYDPQRLPVGPPERLLRLFRAQSTSWQSITGSTVDVPGRSVRGAVSAGGVHGILTAPFVNSVTISNAPALLTVGNSVTLTATPKDETGATLIDRDVTWISSAPTVASVNTNTGALTGLANGSATVTATIEGKSASTAIIVVAPVASITVVPANPVVEVWGSLALTVVLRDAFGNVLSGRSVTWTSSNVGVATVNQQGVVSGIGSGSASLSATSEAITVSIPVSVPVQPALQVSAISPSTLVPGATVTITGNNFSKRISDQTVTVAGVVSTVIGSTQTQLTLALPNAGFPCQSTQPVPVQISRLGSPSVQVQQLLSVSRQRTLALGEATYLLDPAEVRCTELTNTGAALYVVAMINASNSPTSLSGFELRGFPGTGGASLDHARAPMPLLTMQRNGDVRRMLQAARQDDAARASAKHLEIMERNAAAANRLGSPLASIQRLRRGLTNRDVQRPSAAAAVGDISTMRVANLSAADFCNSYSTVQARTIYVGSRAIVMEDMTAPLAGQMDAQYTQIGQQFDNDMFPILANNFGDPLAMDASLDANGRIIMLFTPKVNAIGGVLGFVLSCDFYPQQSASSSNFGEVFYAVVPTTSTGTGSSSTSGWLWDIRATVIHEAKHITAFAERFKRAGSSSPNLEESWLEEGSARVSEELWSRGFSGTTWRGNSAYMTGVYCDFRPTDPACAGRGVAMSKHFTGLYYYYLDNEAKSPLGKTSTSDATFYGSAWSLIRWCIDQQSGPESGFLRSLIQDVALRGVPNLEARCGKTLPEMLAKWSLASWADDRVGITVNGPELSFPSWNTTSVFTGLYGLSPTAFPFSSPYSSYNATYSPWLVRTVLNGGTTTWIRISGTQSGPFLLSLSGVFGGTLSSSIRLAVVRVQ